ncbi:MAG: PQQ-binding-like beta-propeller repeat protein [Deltaproteobacteria bacterium]
MDNAGSPVPGNPLPVPPSPADGSATLASAGTASAAVIREPRLRLWPGVAIVALQAIGITLAKTLAPATMIHFYAMFMGPMAGAAIFVLWWLFASRLPWRDRWLALVACLATAVATLMCAHPTIRGMPILVFALPAVTGAWAAWLLLTPFLRWPVRRAGLLVVVALAWGYFALVRLDGIDGSMRADLAFRWRPTPEETFLKEAAKRSAPATSSAAIAEPLALEPGDWPGFRGPGRDARLPGVRLTANWDRRPPREVWRHRVGPGWSSFAVVGKRLYTQEQLGEEELVICYDAETGGELWSHRDRSRFTEAMAGPGPRATPTFYEGKIYALGANGHLNCLDAATGGVIWARDIAADSGAKIPNWGFSSSPLVVNDMVTVFAGGPKERAVLAYRAATGEPRWSSGTGTFSYCSTQLSRLADVDQLVISTEQGLAAYEPAGGKVLWTYNWPLEGGMSRVVQPARVGEDDFLIGTGFGLGTQRVRVTLEGDEWTAREVWPVPTRAIRPYYNDLVVHQEHIYGFDGAFFTCVDLENGRAKWKARGYGNGQVLLLPDQDRLLILSETGEVALVDAKPDGHRERCKFQAITGKTWNHPVVAHGRLYVRNGEEAACFELEEEQEAGVATRVE